MDFAENSAANGRSTSNITSAGSFRFSPCISSGSAGRTGREPNPKSEIQIRKGQTVAALLAIVALLLLLPARLFEIANPEWRLLAWIHAGVVVTLTLLVIWSAGGKAWVRHFVFPVAFIFVAVPWPTTLETPVIQGLMRVVARVAAETAMLLGTPAQVEGNLIRVTNGLVGVNEACSGIRSLQTSLMIGLLFGELKRLSVSRRVALVTCAVAIALLANFVRAVFLVRIAATQNLSEVGRWHDIAGYSIIALVFVATLGLAYLLGRRKASVVAGVPPAESGFMQPTRLPLQFQMSYIDSRPLLAHVRRNWDGKLVSPARTQSHQQHTLECPMAGASAQLSSIENQRRNSRRAPVR